VLEDLERLRGAERAPVQINWSLPSASPNGDDELEEEIFLYFIESTGKYRQIRCKQDLCAL
jgi:hypothetical protein